MLVGTICIAALAGCVHSTQATGYWGKAEPSGFLKDYSKLHPAADDIQATLVYFMGDKVKFKSYKKVWLEPVQVWRGEKSDAKDMDKEDAEYLSQFLWTKLDEEFRKDYQMVQSPGPDVMHVRIGITEAGKNVPVVDNLTAAYPAAMVLSKGKKYISSTESFVGKSSIEAEATDSQTGEVLAAAVDRRGGGKYPWKSLHRWGDVEEAYT